MKIIIAGAGEVGFHLAKLLAGESQDIVLIDQNEEILNNARSSLDVLALKGDCSTVETLEQADIQQARLLIAVTSNEETNILTSILGKKLGAKKTIARVNKEEYLGERVMNYFKELGVDNIISTKHLASREVLRLINEATLTDIFEFENGKLLLVGISIDDNSLVIGKSLRDTAHMNPKQEFIPIALLRGEETIIPRGDDVFKKNDHVYFLTKPKGLDLIIKLTGKERIKIKNVIILGGSSIGFYTAKALENRYQVKLIEKSKKRCLELAERLNNTLIINGDGSNAELLEQEDIDLADAFIAVTGNSETNIIASLIAKNHKVAKTVALVEKAELTHLSQDIGVDALINRKLIAANNIFRYVRKGKIKDITSLHGVEAEAIEYEVYPGAKITKSKISDLNFPKKALIGGIIRKNKAFIPNGDFQVEAYDQVVVFTCPIALTEVEKFFNQ